MGGQVVSLTAHPRDETLVKAKEGIIDLLLLLGIEDKNTARRQKLNCGYHSDIRGFSHFIFPYKGPATNSRRALIYSDIAQRRHVDLPFRFFSLPSSPILSSI